jgi:hypothetical protein
MLNSIPEQYDPGRKQGALWTLAMQWGAAHDWNNANALVVPFLEAMMRARVPQNASLLDGPVKLNELKEADGWLGDRGTWEGNLATIAPWGKKKGGVGQTDTPPVAGAKSANDRAAMFEKRDKNHDGKLSREELIGNQRDPEAAKARFDKWDVDKDGFLSRDEFINMGGKSK